MSIKKKNSDTSSGSSGIITSKEIPLTDGEKSGLIEKSVEGPTIGPETTQIKRRGRPKGRKDTKPRAKRRKIDKSDKDDAARSFFSVQEKVTSEMYSHLAMEEGEDIITAEVFLAKIGQPSKPGDSVRPNWAFNEQNVERPQWIEAKDLEQTRLLAYNTWRRLEAAEEADWRAGKIKAVTTALILN